MVKKPETNDERRVRRHDSVGVALTAAVAGLMATTAMPPFRGLGLLIIPALALLFKAMQSSRRPARTAWIFGVCHQATLLHWLFMLGDEAPIASRALVPAMAASAILYASLFYLLFGWSWDRLRRKLGLNVALALTPILWTGMEALRGAGELGFPWCLSGAAVLGTPWLRLASAAGEIALGAWCACAATSIVWFFTRNTTGRDRKLRAALAGLTLLGAAALVLGADPGHRPRTLTTIKVASAQANVSLVDKWVPARLDSTLVPYAQLTHEASVRDVDLTVWAETAIPGNMSVKPRLQRWVWSQVRQSGRPLFFGHPYYGFDRQGRPFKFNSSSLVSPAGKVLGRYSKHHLLPFGERIPFQSLFPWLGGLNLGQAEWMVGERPAAIPLRVGGRDTPFAAMICYEAIFPSLARGGARSGARFLVNITNDGWFGYTAGPVQHAEMARVRAAECGMPLVRCANNGISYITDRRGEVLDSAGFGDRKLVVARIPIDRATTPFVRFGSWPLVLFLGVWGGVVLLLTRRNGHER